MVEHGIAEHQHARFCGQFEKLSNSFR